MSEKVKITVEDSLNTLKSKLGYNEGYAEEATKLGIYDDIQFGQRPEVTLVTCSDSRVMEKTIDDQIGKVFSIKNIGNRVEPNMGSIEYGVNHLHTPILMILGHTGCGAVRAATQDATGEHPRIIRSLDFIRPTVSEVQKLLIKKGGMKSYMKNHQDPPATPISEDTYFETLITEANVDNQIEILLKDDAIRRKVFSGSLMLVGAMLDFKDVYSKNRGSIFVININGETDVGKLKKLDVFAGDGTIVINRIKRLLVY
ncbi:carbonic anhydrase [Methanooceanicella nereidis]|uniref:carbonic anhydrase n=1 Tax=Methanooceanicella nereidis TaxID=2052831 RepID=UPI001E2C9F09|nr:carbonic anhydrase [Methanocella sp. CWC-04]